MIKILKTIRWESRFYAVAIMRRLEYYIKACQKHEYKEYTGPHGENLKWCSKCGYNEIFGGFDERFIQKNG